MRIRVIDYCMEYQCRCLHRSGVILYDGPSPSDAAAARKQALYGNTTVKRVLDSPSERKY